MRNIITFLLIVVFLSGCATIQSNNHEWDVERARDVIINDELSKLEYLEPIDGRTLITANDIFCNEDGFTNIYKTGSIEDNPQIGLHIYTSYYSLRYIRFDAIRRVYTKPAYGFFGILADVVMLGSIVGTDRYVALEMTSGETYITDWIDSSGITNIFPFWIFKVILRDPPIKGVAIDYLRQQNQGNKNGKNKAK